MFVIVHYQQLINIYTSHLLLNLWNVLYEGKTYIVMFVYNVVHYDARLISIGTRLIGVNSYYTFKKAKILMQWWSGDRLLDIRHYLGMGNRLVLLYGSNNLEFGCFPLSFSTNWNLTFELVSQYTLGQAWIRSQCPLYSFRFI